jgi:hypothetical protein
MTEKKVPQTVGVSWAFVIGVDTTGVPHFFDYEDVAEVKALRVAVLDDIHAAVSIASADMEFHSPSEIPYVVAFLVFQVPNGYIAASPNIFENISPFSYPSAYHIRGALNVLQSQITAQRTLDLLASVATAATVSTSKPDENKTPGGLIVV